MKLKIITEKAEVSVNKTGLFRQTGNINIIAEMTEEQMKDLFYAIWNKVGDDVIENCLLSEGFKMVKA